MSSLKIGDIVARKSYGGDILFKVVDIQEEGKEKVITLKGIIYRIQADAPESDLVLQTERYVNDYSMKANRKADRICREIQSSNILSSSKKNFFRDTPKGNASKFTRPGRVLHLDGDNDYLDTCLSQYRKFGMEVVGKYVQERDQSANVFKLLQENKPDILVLTGHDGMIKGSSNYVDLNNYSNSRYFIEAVREARRYENDLDSLVIFAGACQSLYKGIIDAGANFASSPYRVLIHALDPVFICRKVAFTSIEKVLDSSDVISSTITGLDGIGGIQTRGKFRDGYPLEPYNS